MNKVEFIKLSAVKDVFDSRKRNDLCVYFKNSENLTMSRIEFLQEWLAKHKCKLKNKTFYILTGKLFNKALSHYSNGIYCIDNEILNEIYYNKNNKKNVIYYDNITIDKLSLQKLVDDNKKDSGYTDDNIFLLIRLSDISNIKPLQNLDKFDIGLYRFSDVYMGAHEKCYGDHASGLFTDKVYLGGTE